MKPLANIHWKTLYTDYVLITRVLRYVCRNYYQFELIISNYLLEYKILARKRPLGRYDGQLR